MTPTEYFQSQVFFNKNLQEMSPYDQSHVVSMISEYATMCVEECRVFVMGELKKMTDSIPELSETNPPPPQT